MLQSCPLKYRCPDQPTRSSSRPLPQCRAQLLLARSSKLCNADWSNNLKNKNTLVNVGVLCVAFSFSTLLFCFSFPSSPSLTLFLSLSLSLGLES